MIRYNRFKTRSQFRCYHLTKKAEQLYKVSSPVLDDYNFKQEEPETVGQLSEVCSQIVFKSLYLERIGRPDILWSVNKLSRSVAKWTQACDRRLARLISYLHHTSDYRQHCHVGDTNQHRRSGLLQDSDFSGDLEDSKSTSGGVSVLPISWMCKKQTSVFHGSAESAIISLDAGLRMDGFLAFHLWDVVIEVLCSTNNTKTPSNPASGNRCGTGNCSRNISKLKLKENRDVDQLLHVDHVPTNAHSSR